MEPDSDHVFSVGELNEAAGDLLESAFASVQVTGELHEIRRPASGHWYFTLKDEHSELRCVMFRGDNQQVGSPPSQGDQLLLRGRLAIYRQRGQYQMIVRGMEAAGEGQLLRRFEALRKALTAEGLFDTERKRALPPCPRHLAVVTSRTGAVIRDVLAVTGRRAPLLAITLVPASVQGDRAPASLCRALDVCEQWNAEAADPFDAVLVCRGGGSLEDLWAFNEEVVVRRIAALKIPCIAGIGHETDTTLSDFVADVRAATPSAAAEILTEAQAQWPDSLRGFERQLNADFRRQLEARMQSLDQLEDRLISPTRRFADRRQRLADLSERLSGSIRRSLRGRTQSLDQLQNRLISPTRRLRERRQSLADLTERLSRSVERNKAGSTEKLRELQRDFLASLLGGAVLSHARHRLDFGAGELQRLAKTLVRESRGKLEQDATALQALSPLAVLERGYAILSDRAGRAQTDADKVEIGAQLRARLAKGNLNVRVESRD